MRYARRRSPLHAVRAGVAAVWCVVLSGVALAVAHPVVLAVLLAVVLLCGRLTRLGGDLGRALLFGLPFALTIAVINPLVTREGLTVIFRLGALPPFGQLDITLEATAYGGVLGLRALVVGLCFVLFARAVDPDELLRAFRRVSYRSALTAALATRLVGVLARDARRMHAAQRARASRPAPRLAILRAVTAGALDRSIDVAATLEVRGYGSAQRPPRRREPWSRHDVAFATSAAGLAVLAALPSVTGVAAFDAYPRLQAELGAAEIGLCGALAAVALLPFADRRGTGR